MAISKEDYLDIKKSMGAKSAKEAVKASYDRTPAFKSGKTSGNYLTHSESLKKEGEYRQMAKDRASKNAKSQALSKRSGGKSGGSFIDRLEAHKAEARSFDNGTWKPKRKGQTFIQALEEHKSKHEFD